MEKAKLPFELLPRELSERIRRKILKMPQLDIERDGAMVTDCDLRIKGLDGDEVVYSFVIDVFGPKTVELARRLEEADGEPHQNSRTFELETGMRLEGWPGRKEVRWMARRIAKDCAEFYLSKVYYGFEGDANILLDAMRENEENRDIIEEMRVPCGPKGDKGYVGSDRAPAPDEHPANRVLPEEIAALMASAEFFDEKRYGNTTVVTAKLPNGWTITEQSACIDPDDYDHDLGVEICKERIEDELWKLEGYRKVCERAVRDGEQG